MRDLVCIRCSAEFQRFVSCIRHPGRRADLRCKCEIERATYRKLTLGAGPSFFHLQTQRKSAVSPLYRNSAIQLVSAMTAEAKPFNNHIGFERGLWKHQTTTFKDVPKRSVFKTPMNYGSTGPSKSWAKLASAKIGNGFIRDPLP